MEGESKKTSIQVSPELRDRLYRLKFRKTYEQFLDELCDVYEAKGKKDAQTSSSDIPDMMISRNDEL